jgi:hypothetical protein
MYLNIIITSITPHYQHSLVIHNLQECLEVYNRLKFKIHRIINTKIYLKKYRLDSHRSYSSR